MIRVVTYNIHKARGLDRKVWPARIAEVLRSLHADVIALQEVVNADGREREAHQTRFLAEELGMHWAVGETRRLGDGSYGNSVLSRFPLAGTCNYDISVTGREPRGCLRTDIEVPDKGALHVFNVHLGTSFFERREQAQCLLREEVLRSRHLRGPRIVLGDFNEWTHGLASQLLYSEFRCGDIRLHMNIKATYPGVLPVMHLDHIYYDHGLRLEAVGLARTRLALVASDHLPIWADFSWRENGD